MKRLVLVCLALLLVLVLVLVYRAETHFTEQSAGAVSSQDLPDLDIAAASSRLAKAISYPTISYDNPDRRNDAAFIGLREHMLASFPRVYAAAPPRLLNEHSLLFKFPGSRSDLKPALFMGHVDVVPVDSATADQWRFPPFSGAIEDGVIWGRGAMDDKVTVFALLEAMGSLLESGLQPQRTLYFAFGHDEEIGGPMGAAAMAELLEDEGVEFEFVLDEGGVITQGSFPGIEAPVALVGIAEKGFVNLRLTVNAPGGHSSQPPDHTAAGILSQAIVALESHPFSSDLRYTKMTMDYVGKQSDFMTRLVMANLWLFEPVVANVLAKTPATAALTRSTIAATMLEGSSKSNILPTRATAVVNVRIMPGDSVASVREHFVNAIADPRVEVSTFMENEPSAVSPTESLGYQLIQKNIRAMDESVLVAPYLVIGGTDSKHFYSLSPNIYRFIMVKADAEGLKRIHGVNEQLPVEDYRSAIQFFRALLTDAARA
ncbi:M20 family peptidase [Congregibacter variabilis]|uniref:M20 family peptidase n=1 Tax=Congregibacter variabilis TaxID=3081200 RepID=A0ABZ0I0H0_9GAMM|nr:M20 family peptidase [Congregibacter sp. IMCC43200]